jgi:hypothetical protein
MIQHNGWEIGHYKNTFFDDTAVAGYFVPLANVGNFELGVHMVATYGYKFCINEMQVHKRDQVCAGVMPEIRYTRWKIQPTLISIGQGVAVSFKIQL